MDNLVNIIHLSDLHFGRIDSAGLSNDLDKVHETFSSLITKIAEINDERKIDYIVISGDVGFTGKSKDYDETKGPRILSAGDFLKSFNDRLFRSHMPVFIVCPGNHDIEFVDFDPKKKNKKNVITREQQFKEVVASRNISDAKFIDLISNFSSFTKFLKNKKIAKLQYNQDKLKNLSGYVYFEKEDIAFVVLNSAWLSNPNRESDYGELMLSKNLVNSIFTEVCKKNPDILITVFHHPPYWLNWNERFGSPHSSNPVMQKITHKSEILLTGHEHCNILPPDSLQSKSLLFTTGASFESPPKGIDFYFNSFQLLQINKDDNSIHQKCFRQNAVGGRYTWEEEPISNKSYHFKSNKCEREIIDIKNYKPINYKNRLTEFEKWSEEHALKHEIVNFLKKTEYNSLLLEVKSKFELSEDSIVRIRINREEEEIYKNLKKELENEIQANICILETV
jgi:Icc-related predicted phosphoesterase